MQSHLSNFRKREFVKISPLQNFTLYGTVLLMDQNNYYEGMTIIGIFTLYPVSYM